MTSHPSRRTLSPLLASLSGLGPSPLTMGSLLTSRYPPPPTPPTPAPSLLSLSVSMKKGQCERKNRRVNRGKRSRVFYTRYKYLQKCGWNTWNTHEGKERVGNIAAGGFLHTWARDPHTTIRDSETYNKVFLKSVCIDNIQRAAVLQ